MSRERCLSFDEHFEYEIGLRRSAAKVYCYEKIKEGEETQVVVVCSEASREGISLTNSIEAFATQYYNKELSELVDPSSVRWIQYEPDDEDFYLVIFDWQINEDGKWVAENPKWKPLRGVEGLSPEEVAKKVIEEGEGLSLA